MINPSSPVSRISPCCQSRTEPSDLETSDFDKSALRQERQHSWRQRMLTAAPQLFPQKYTRGSCFGFADICSLFDGHDGPIKDGSVAAAKCCKALVVMSSLAIKSQKTVTLTEQIISLVQHKIQIINFDLLGLLIP